LSNTQTYTETEMSFPPFLLLLFTVVEDNVFGLHSLSSSTPPAGELLNVGENLAGYLIGNDLGLR
jgi:hypothetical protein